MSEQPRIALVTGASEGVSRLSVPALLITNQRVGSMIT